MSEEEPAEFEISAERFRFKLPSAIVTRLANQALDLVSPATEAMAYLGDLVRGQRQLAAARNFMRVKELLEEAHKPAIVTDRRFLIEWVDRGSADLDGELTDEWARLLISQAEAPSSLKRSFISILAALGPNEVQFLDRLYRNITTEKLSSPFGKLSYYGFQFADEDELRANWTRDHGQSAMLAGRRDSNALSAGEDTLWIDENYQSMILLKSLGLVDLHVPGDDVDWLSAFLTPLGIEFVEACSGPTGSDLGSE